MSISTTKLPHGCTLNTWVSKEIRRDSRKVWLKNGNFKLHAALNALLEWLQKTARIKLPTTLSCAMSIFTTWKNIQKIDPHQYSLFDDIGE